VKHLYSGKVRDLYEVDDDTLLMVASDRVSVYDVILPDPIPDKGRVLTAISAFWFERTADVVANHVISFDPADFPLDADPEFAGRAVLVRRTETVKLECIVRGYLFGHAWSEYQERGTVNGVPLPAGLREADQLPEPIFTPTTKAPIGAHDVAVTAEEGRELVGAELYDRLAQASLSVYIQGARHAAERGILLADTKFEFGFSPEGDLLLIDEVLTPDSSRYWDAETWAPGGSPASFDKQFVRDAVRATGWVDGDPAPRLAPDVIAGTRARYVDAYRRLTDRSIDDWYGPRTTQ